MPTALVIATGNVKKLVELRRILHGLDVDLVSMTDLGLPEPVEDGDTFAENALIKARSACAESGLPALADDSGLEVTALGGAPGVRSARYAGTNHPSRSDNDAANNAKLLAALSGVSDRTARFVCAAALVLPDGREWVVHGQMRGQIIDTPRGTRGFGYDPHFVADGETRTNAELAPHEKDERSHRGEAFRGLRLFVAEAVG